MCWTAQNRMRQKNLVYVVAPFVLLFFGVFFVRSFQSSVPSLFSAVSDEELALELVTKLHTTPCSAATPIAWSETFVAGFGHIVLWRILGFHRAILENRIFVFPDDFARWGFSPRNAFAASSCQDLFEKNGNSFFTDAKFDGSGSNVNDYVKHPQFRHKPLLWWYQQLVNYFFRPDLSSVPQPYLASLFHSVLPSGQSLLPSTPFVDLRKLFPAHRLIGVHIRHGDSCTTTDVNTYRPPCQSPTLYSTLILKYMTHEFCSFGTSQFVVFVASDDQAAPEELKQDLVALTPANISVTVTWLNIDRAKYRPVGKLKIEAFAREEHKMEMFYDFSIDLAIVAQADVLMGQGFSSFFNLALLRSHADQWGTVDHAVPCVRGGCVGPLAQDKTGNCEWFSNDYDLRASKLPPDCLDLQPHTCVPLFPFRMVQHLRHVRNCTLMSSRPGHTNVCFRNTPQHSSLSESCWY
eukprot:gnl/Spiro4/5301_TR2691_c0_g1_i1.p1 gnl/Spiro4/5301_TR2691_c0_g1~~gnl/Spiro4/5301_TR2691_c0_g1_i1.p1  ORF type:complete len:473 (+),score=45.14 gnl/Spiro4/5301_TR2691_c0_g1_i1:28-1419(+)